MKTQNYVLLSSLYQQKAIEKFPKLLSKGFERSVYWNKYKTKMEIRMQHRNIDVFLKQTLYVLAGCFFGFIQIEMTILKDLKVEGITYQKVLSRIITSSLMEKTSTTNQLIRI